MGLQCHAVECAALVLNQKDPQEWLSITSPIYIFFSSSQPITCTHSPSLHSTGSVFGLWVVSTRDESYRGLCTKLIYWFRLLKQPGKAACKGLGNIFRTWVSPSLGTIVRLPPNLFSKLSSPPGAWLSREPQEKFWGLVRTGLYVSLCTLAKQIKFTFARSRAHILPILQQGVRPASPTLSGERGRAWHPKANSRTLYH